MRREMQEIFLGIYLGPYAAACKAQEWCYSMRREMQEIFPGLYLGPYAAAFKAQLDNLLKHGITHIVCIRQGTDSAYIRPQFPEKFKYMILEIRDTVVENIIKHIPLVSLFLDDCLNSGGRVLVHGNTGISRSGALVVGYMMEKFSISFDEAMQYVQQKRFCVNPNEGFVQQLLEYESIYKARKAAIYFESFPTRENGSGKRKYCEDNDVEMSA